MLPPHQQVDLLDAQVPAKEDMGMHHVPDRDWWKTTIIRPPCPGILAQRAGTAITGTQNIGTYNKVLVRIDQAFGSYHPRPPPGHIRIGSQRVTYPYYIAPVRIQTAVRIISDRNTRQRFSTFQVEAGFIGKIIHPRIFVF
jgi:hypothetical protein